MNIIRVRQSERLKRIEIIVNSLKKSKNPDINKLVMFCCSEWGISQRTAKEYIKIAEFKLDA